MKVRPGKVGDTCGAIWKIDHEARVIYVSYGERLSDNKHGPVARMGNGVLRLALCYAWGHEGDVAHQAIRYDCKGYDLRPIDVRVANEAQEDQEAAQAPHQV